MLTIRGASRPEMHSNRFAIASMLQLSWKMAPGLRVRKQRSKKYRNGACRPRAARVHFWPLILLHLFALRLRFRDGFSRKGRYRLAGLLRSCDRPPTAAFDRFGYRLNKAHRLVSPPRAFWMALNIMASYRVSFLGSGILRPSLDSISSMMIVFLFLLPFVRPFLLPDFPS